MHVTAHRKIMSHTPTHLGRPYGPYLGPILFFKREKEKNIDVDHSTQLSNLLFYYFWVHLGRPAGDQTQ